MHERQYTRIDTIRRMLDAKLNALQHFLRNPMEDFWFERGRVPALVKELGGTAICKN